MLRLNQNGYGWRDALLDVVFELVLDVVLDVVLDAVTLCLMLCLMSFLPCVCVICCCGVVDVALLFSYWCRFLCCLLCDHLYRASSVTIH